MSTGLNVSIVLSGRPDAQIRRDARRVITFHLPAKQPADHTGTSTTSSSNGSGSRPGDEDTVGEMPSSAARPLRARTIDAMDCANALVSSSTWPRGRERDRCRRGEQYGLAVRLLRSSSAMTPRTGRRVGDALGEEVMCGGCARIGLEIIGGNGVGRGVAWGVVV